MDRYVLGKFVVFILSCCACGTAETERPAWHSKYDVLRMMNRSKDPCDDFYEYSCGSYIENINLTDHDTHKLVFNDLADEMNLQLKNALERPESAADKPSERFVKTLYRSCMNEGAAEGLGLQPLKNFVSQLDGWPVLEGNRWRRKHWQKTEALIFKLMGKSPTFLFSVKTDEKDSNKQVLYIDQPELLLIDRDYYIDDKYVNERQAYIQFINATIIQMGGNADTAYNTAQEIFDFERTLAALSEPEERRRDHEADYRGQTVALVKRYFQLHRQYDFSPFFNHMTDLGFPLNERQYIVVNGLPYFWKLSERLKRYFSDRVITNYQVWYVIYKMREYLPQSLRNNELPLREALYGVGAFEPRLTQCMTLVEKALPDCLGALYVKSLGQNDIKNQAETIIETIVKAMKETIQNSDWMDARTKRNALKKLQTMQSHTAYPDYYSNDTRLMYPFREVTLFNDRFFENMLHIDGTGFKIAIEKLATNVDRGQWITGAAVINAFYEPTLNTIVFPIGILGFPFFDDRSKKYQNYGRMGLVIGHEITHGFDDTGKQYDENGNLALWWDHATQRHYADKAQCFIDQYGNVTEELTGRRVNGIITQGENIADNGAAKLGHRAYQIWLSRASEATKRGETLNGFTSDQLYFISFAQAWCAKYRPAYMGQLLEIDEHAPAKIRVNVPLQNYPEFSKAFRCAGGKPMNPVQKCHVW